MHYKQHVCKQSNRWAQIIFISNSNAMVCLGKASGEKVFEKSLGKIWENMKYEGNMKELEWSKRPRLESHPEHLECYQISTPSLLHYQNSPPPHPQIVFRCRDQQHPAVFELSNSPRQMSKHESQPRGDSRVVGTSVLTFGVVSLTAQTRLGVVDVYSIIPFLWNHEKKW